MKRVWLVLLGLAFVSVTNAQIYQFRGPHRDGKFPEKNLLKEWPDGGPELLLEFEGIGEGYSSVSDLFIADPENGEIRASYKYFDPSLWKWQPRGMIWANSPVVKGNMIYIAIGYDYPAKMLRVNEEVTSIEEVYTSTLLDNHHHGLIELDGYLYGSYWVNNNAGNWACLEWNTGKVMYDDPWIS